MIRLYFISLECMVFTFIQDGSISKAFRKAIADGLPREKVTNYIISSAHFKDTGFVDPAKRKLIWLKFMLGSS